MCIQLWEQICVGLCQKTAELSGMRCLLHSLAVGVSIMRATQGCLCGRMFLYILHVYMYSTCVSLSSKCAMKTTFFFFTVTESGYSGYSPDGKERCPEVSEHHQNTHQHNNTHTESWLRLACLVKVYLKKCIFVLCINQEGEKLLVHKNKLKKKIVCAY